jgi:hypothetical protein
MNKGINEGLIEGITKGVKESIIQIDSIIQTEKASRFLRKGPPSTPLGHPLGHPTG